MASRNVFWDLLFCYACFNLLTPRRERVIVQQVPVYTTTATAVSAAAAVAATGGADLPLIACARIVRDEPGESEEEA